MPQKTRPKAPKQPAQHQRRQPGLERPMRPRPRAGEDAQPHAPKLRDKVAIITGGDSGIGRAAAIAFAKQGADVAILYLDEHRDAARTARDVEAEGRRALRIAGDIGSRAFCARSVARVARDLGRPDILVNNAAEQHLEKNFAKIDLDTVERTFRTNILSFFFMTRAVLPHLRRGSVIINTTSVTAYRGSEHLVDYASTKGAIVSFTRSLALALAEKGIRVNAVAPGPVWTPLIPSTFPPKQVRTFGSDVPLGRPAQPGEIAPCYVFLASGDSSYMTGQVLHPNGGEVVNA